MNIPDQLTQVNGSLVPEGFNRVTREASVQRQERIGAAMGLWADTIEGKSDPFFLKQAFHPSDEGAFRVLCEKYPVLFRETMTTSDFNSLTVDVLDRQLLGNYNEVPIPVLPMVKRAQLRDFRNARRYMMDGMEGVLTPVEEMAPVPQRSFAQSSLEYKPRKYEAGTSFSWEAVINDDLGIFMDIPQRLGRAARRTLHRFITTLYIDANGPNALLYNVANANIINIANGAASNNPALTIQGLRDALTVLYKKTDTGGDPIDIGGSLYLFVPPSLYVTAMDLMNQLSVDVSAAPGTTTRIVRVNNWIVSGMTVIRDPYIQSIATTNGNTTWGLMADPGSQGRPALEVGFLRGYETPQLYQKAPNTMRLGGGIEPLLGDFQTMATELKVLMVFGGTQIDGKSTVASNGSGA